MTTSTDSSKTTEELELYGEKWKSGQSSNEIKLVSADNFSFYVPKYLLQANSRVLCESLELPAESPPIIAFSDREFEYGNLIALFLLVNQGVGFSAALKELHDEYNYPSRRVSWLFGFLLFAKKYDCRIPLRLWHNYLYNLVRENYPPASLVWPLDVFVLAARADLPDLSALVLELYVPNPTDPPDLNFDFTFAEFGCLASHLPFELEHFPREAWDHLPVRYLYALQQSSAKNSRNTEQGGSSKGSVMGSKRRAQIFREALDHGGKAVNNDEDLVTSLASSTRRA
ncbi:hypothetical protein L202_03182 [Cryptococcus amylolentus CBS 6039]|uniref:BTB domain-containing protein n=2 Tax=Cryptococcus amylolentus TaxID=104669 RepID=A0A1E3HXV3_9TREE|nr:hypothetical protein L202_03182 [Cryptococcus amylolentus CBS 6039]ODN81087.1 hypothetical protein L202_03182 [Cryptococcus amylolentus CBS 6039]ODO09546.1 hypothetical protein I350_03149 [Cryptococcus amylolentus CBS 6273]